MDAMKVRMYKQHLVFPTYNPRYAKANKEIVESAIANAENNNGMNVENLYIEECYANKGPTMKRIKPRAQVKLQNRKENEPHYFSA